MGVGGASRWAGVLPSPSAEGKLTVSPKTIEIEYGVSLSDCKIQTAMKTSTPHFLSLLLPCPALLGWLA